MRRIIRPKVLMVLAGGLIALAVAGTVFAQTPPRQGTPSGPSQDNWGGCWGDGTYQNTMWEALAQSLGLTTDQLTQQMQSGKSLHAIAKDKGMSDADLVKSLRSAMQSMVDQLVQAGQVTRAQADTMLQYMQSYMTDDRLLAMSDRMGSGNWGSMGWMMGSGGWGAHGSMMGGNGWAGPGGMMGQGSWSGSSSGGWGMGPGYAPGATGPRGGRGGYGGSMMGRYY